MTTDGDVLCTSNNTSPSQVKQLTETDECQRILTYAHFLNGKINNPIVLSQIIKAQGWTKEEYTTMANAISNIHVSRHPVSLLKNKALEKLCGWEENTAAQERMSAPTTIHKRYRKPVDEKSDTNARQILHRVKVMDKEVNDVLPPITSPSRALEGYIFGEDALPVVSRGEALAPVQHSVLDYKTEAKDRESDAIKNLKIRILLDHIDTLPKKHNAIPLFKSSNYQTAQTLRINILKTVENFENKNETSKNTL